MSFNYKEIIAVITILLWVIGFVPYVKGLIKGTVKPHMFSWFVWFLLMAIAYAIQVHEKAGPGSWVIGLTALSCLGISIAAFFKGEKNITRSDWYSFVGALLALPLWYMTDDPTGSVILITLIDALGFYPTFRKSWDKPYDETISLYLISAVKCLLSVVALDVMNVNTALYPFSLFMMNGAFVLLLIWRRRSVFNPLTRSK